MPLTPSPLGPLALPLANTNIEDGGARLIPERAQSRRAAPPHNGTAREAEKMSASQRAEGALTTITIADAVALLASKLGEVAEARRVLVERAQIGDLLTYATRAHGPFDGQSLNERDWPIPADLWQRLGVHSDDEWRRGDLT